MLQHLKGYQRSITFIKTGRLNKKTTQLLIHKKKRKETGEETNIGMCNSSASTNANTINSKSSIHISWFFYYSGSQINNNFNIFRKDWDAVLLERLLGSRFHSWVPLYLNIRGPNLVLTHFNLVLTSSTSTVYGLLPSPMQVPSAECTTEWSRLVPN